MSYDPTTDAGKVRRQIADTDSAIFTDAEIQGFLDGENGSWLLASADALDSLAALYARKSQKLGVLDITIDTTNIAKDLRAQAKQLRENEAQSSAFEIAEMVEPGFARTERREKEWERTHE